jgi:AcrR family transcriptional regulator
MRSSGSSRLPRGRHQLSKEDVAASQRTRIVGALVALVAERGFRPVTVADVVARAEVSRRTFYEHFDDKESCFVAAFQFGVELLMDHVRGAVQATDGGGDWRDRVATGMSAYLEGMASHPDFAWVFTFEAVAAGPQVLAHRAEVLQRWVAQWRGLHEVARRAEPDLAPVTDSQLLVLVGGIEELVRESLRTRGPEHLAALREPATAAALALLDRRR